MSVLRPRTRLVNFRLSVDEFDKLKASCSLHGARSVSDFARSSVLERMENQPNGQFGSQGRLFHLDHKVAELELRVTQLLQVLQTGPSAPAQTPAQTPVQTPVMPPPLFYETALAARSGASGD